MARYVTLNIIDDANNALGFRTDLLDQGIEIVVRDHAVRPTAVWCSYGMKRAINQALQGDVRVNLDATNEVAIGLDVGMYQSMIGKIPIIPTFAIADDSATYSGTSNVVSDIYIVTERANGQEVFLYFFLPYMTINLEELRNLYLEKNYSAKEIADILNVPLGKIRHLLRKNKISRNEGAKFNQSFREPLTREFLYKHYVKLNWSMAKIQKEYNLSHSKVKKGLQRFNILKPAELKFKKGNPQLKTRNALLHMYEVEELSIIQIAEKLGITTGAVTKLFKSRRIPIDKNSRYKRTRKNFELRYINYQRRKFEKKFLKELQRKRSPGSRKGKKFSDETITKMRNKAIARGTNKISKAELEAADFLSQIGVPYEQQFRLSEIGIFDFRFLDFPKVVLEVDGAYYHSLPEIKKRDKVKMEAANNQGWKIYRIAAEKVNLGTIFTLANYIYADNQKPIWLF